MKLAQLTDPATKAALEKVKDGSLPVLTAWKVKNLLIKFNEEVKKYEEFRGELVRKHSQKDESGQPQLDQNNTINVAEGNLQEFFKDLQEVLNQEVDIGSLKLSELGTKLELSADDLLKLDSLIKE